MFETVSLQPSSNIAAAQYDQETLELVVTFKNGTSYMYSPVPGNVVTDWSNAQSSGQYFNAFIKGQFEFRRL